MHTSPDGEFTRTQHAFLVSSDKDLANLLQGLWPEEQVRFVSFEHGRRALEYLFNEPPDLLVVDNHLTDMDGAELAALVKSENVYRQLPVVLCLGKEDLEEKWDWTAVEVDDFLVRPFDGKVVKARLNLTLSRALRALDANPLTKLPGNTSIIQRIQDLIDLKEDFALAYVDLDNFKSFNDKYGFSRGDEVLMMAARIIVNTVKSFTRAKTFVGHVGGDDYVFIVPPEVAEKACQNIIENFDGIVPHFYDQEDRDREGIVSTDRQGNVREFPLMCVSIGVVFNTNGRLEHYGEASSIAMSLKKKAKETVTSSYVLDKRET